MIRYDLTKPSLALVDKYLQLIIEHIFFGCLKTNQKVGHYTKIRVF
jgi:hypothetical protein